MWALNYILQIIFLHIFFLYSANGYINDESSLPKAANLSFTFLRFPSGKSFIHWIINRPTHFRNLLQFNITLIYDGQSDTHLLSPNELYCPLEEGITKFIVAGFCMELEKGFPPNNISFIFFNNGTITTSLLGGTKFEKVAYEENVLLAKAHHHGGQGHGGNKTIEEMFHAVQSEIGQLRQHIDVLGNAEKTEEKITRLFNGFISACEVFLIWAGPLLAAIGAVIAAKLGLKRGNEVDEENRRQRQQQQNEQPQDNIIVGLDDEHGIDHQQQHRFDGEGDRNFLLQ